VSAAWETTLYACVTIWGEIEFFKFGRSVYVGIEIGVLRGGGAVFELMKGNFRAACDGDWRDEADYYGGPQRMKQRGLSLTM